MMTPLAISGFPRVTSARSEAAGAEATWHTAALAILSVRFIEGFIYWGGGSRRFICASSKLDPDATSWMANKFQSAIPGALIETDSHLLVPAPAFSAVELIAGLMLMAGLLKHSGRGALKLEPKTGKISIQNREEKPSRTERFCREIRVLDGFFRNKITGRKTGAKQGKR
jgi:hypothetical protein